MKDPYVEGASQVGRRFNAVPLQNAVLCAGCDVVSDSPHDAWSAAAARYLASPACLVAIFRKIVPTWS